MKHRNAKLEVGRFSGKISATRKESKMYRSAHGPNGCCVHSIHLIAPFNKQNDQYSRFSEQFYWRF